MCSENSQHLIVRNLKAMVASRPGETPSRAVSYCARSRSDYADRLPLKKDGGRPSTVVCGIVQHSTLWLMPILAGGPGSLL